MQALNLHLAPVQAPPFVLIDHHGADQSADGHIVDENAHDIGSTLDFCVQSL